MDEFLAIPPTLPAQVLLVEDDARLEEILSASMEEDNIVLTRAKNGREALLWLSQSRFDLILLDLGLPEMDGLEFLREYQKAPASHQIPVIVLTAWQETQNKLKSF